MDVRQAAFRLPVPIRWVRETARAIAAKANHALLKIVKTPWGVWDGYLNEEAVASGYTYQEAIGRLEVFYRWRYGEGWTKPA